MYGPYLDPDSKSCLKNYKTETFEHCLDFWWYIDFMYGYKF